MKPADLIGAAGATSIQQRLAALTSDDGVARYLLDRLTGEQVAAITEALLKAPGISAQLKIAIPRDLVDGRGLPEDVVTDDRTVAIRNAECDKPALLLANTDDDQGASLQDVTLIGAKQLTEDVAPWVEAASAGLGLPDGQLEAWRAALAGLHAADDWTLHQISNFVALVRERIADESKPVQEALGWALPALHLPRDSGYFIGIKDRDLEQPRRWKKLFDKLISDRKPLMSKMRPNRQVIEPDELQAQFEQSREDIVPGAHDAIEEFIGTPPGWSAAAEAVAQFEWEADNVLLLFSGLKLKKTTLAEDTINFFEFELPGRLSDSDEDYLKALKSRSLKETRDDDREFFETHRDDLAQDKPLRAKWERFIFGRPIECTDFLTGLLLVVERLFGQVNAAGGPRTLTIRSARRSRSQWLDMNADIGLAFGLRYRGLPALMGDAVKWDAPYIFEYEALLERAKKRKKYRRNESVSRASLQIKFDVELVVGLGAAAERAVVQLVWAGQPNAIGAELSKDARRLLERPLRRTSVARLPVSRKGALQSVSLTDVGTLQPAFGQDAGSLVPRTNVGDDVAKLFPRKLKEARASSRLDQNAADELSNAWQAFTETYAQGVQAWSGTGYADAILLKQAEAYGGILRALATHAPGDINRQELWEPVLGLGTVQITGAGPSAIVAPWHPMRLAATAIKMRSVAGLVDYLLSDNDVNFGDSRLFFSDLRDELSHPLYPEIAVGYDGSEPVLLAETGTVNDYSLFERPVRDPAEAGTDVDPQEAARQIRGLLERYLDLQPHEGANLSIMLYNCDAAGLPLAAVNVLSTVQDEDEMHCNVLVRHRDRNRLAQVYSELLEKSEGDPDAIVVSETSRNFMSKLRIGVMLDGSAGPKDPNGRQIDVAFLHDVVSRQAKEHWFPVPAADKNPALLEHVPSRWSYRRVTAEDELKATSYLTCPRQPDAGWAYVDAVAGVIRRQSHGDQEHYLPARQISFQDHGLKSMFDEVHLMAEWVATYDDLLDKRQLAAQGINVIRYRRQRTHGRNMVVSSTSELRLLHVLVRRRLAELNLGLSDERLSDLARRMIGDANAISGDIVLRAAKRGVSAGELIGLVLSRALVAEELGSGAAVAWFLLDDYAEWLGQREEGLADILALSVGVDALGTEHLRAVVTEAKYVDASGLAEASRKSRQQLRQTVTRMDDALFGDPGRLDRDLWLSRIADLLLDGTAALGHSTLLERVRDGIRHGSVPIDLRGYSHIFISGPASDASSAGEQEPIADISGALQETFTREGLRALIKAYESNSALSPQREALGGEHPWQSNTFKSPAPRVDWTKAIDLEPKAPLPKAVAVQIYEEDDDDGGDEDGETVQPLPSPGPQSGSSGAVATASLPEADPLALDSSANISPAAPPPEEPAAKAAGVASSTHSLAALVQDRAERAREDTADDQAWLNATAQKLRSALLGYSLQAKIVGSRLTPNAALVRFQGSDRLRVEDIEARQSALLTTHGLRLISISPLPGEIVVGVARPHRQTVSMWDVWSRREFNRNAVGVNTSFVLGLKELDGDILYLNLGGPFAGGTQHEPHTLIAGATGSGKSVLIQALLLDIAATNASRLTHIHLIDPKMGVDYAAVERLPHLQGGVIVDQVRAVEVMEGVVAEMERRYDLFRQRGARDIRTYNEKVDKADQLPWTFLVHDEFAEWMLTEDYKAAVTANVSRLGVKARAAGIHLIFAAQRPDANVMPMQLRDNLGNRLILKVASVGTSEIALGVKGAEQLLGLGHLAARLSGEPTVIYAQAPFLSDDDIDRAVDAIIAGDTGAA
ncbi:cell division protein FtsK [Phenylobacterium sp. Root77]|uniref:FtsK/SpoIIIE domain-containing protein n=1 Tax=unclassified Phenylobacterium TaxID=2640670 RepID=UPI0006FAAE2C|nr:MULTISPECIES: FtsK/SpoIIIE domain-containing protein [unclassified Phenylobacterium]KQW70834.1 cell division protein FtsK [Phenylobacterium sp. Root1277]KQW90744.1 cell division protein FtsK [Phenylobacterium sp. Root1290]KRC39623.1 cell division protein FtsK [Phenylobacterium sp. Root77]